MDGFRRLLTLACGLQNAAGAICVLLGIYFALHELAPPDSASDGEKPTPRSGSNDKFLLGPGNVINIAVLQNPDLIIETRVSENDAITIFPVGSVQVVRSSLAATEAQIARLLKEQRGCLIGPQVTALVEQINGSRSTALGPFNGGSPMETTRMGCSSLRITRADGVAPTGLEIVIFPGARGGDALPRQNDLVGMFDDKQMNEDPILRPGNDALFANRYAFFHAYGKVQRSSSYRLERAMNLALAPATGGAFRPRDAKGGPRTKRKDAPGTRDRPQRRPR